MPLLESAAIMAFSATANPERAKAFYRDQLCLRLISDERFELVFEAGGTMLHVQKVHHIRPSLNPVVGWQVPDIEAQVDELTASGVQFERYVAAGQDDRGIWSPPGSSTKVAHFKDPDGNILSLTQV